MKRSLILLLIVQAGMVSAQQTSLLQRLKPDMVSTQYAGSIGMLSAGAGYIFAKNHLHGSVHYGFVPKSLGGRLDIVSAKLSYIPFVVPLRNRSVFLMPLNPVGFVSYTLNKDFYLVWPDTYVDDYYWWSSALRWHIGFSSEVYFKTQHNHLIDGLSLFVEANTNDLYIMSLRGNTHALSVWDITGLGVGVKWKLK